MPCSSEILKKITAFCAYQERCHKEVRAKLFELGAWKDDAEETMAWLITENYLNEERFAKAYAGGKFRIKKWGKAKIIKVLKQKGISEYCVKKGIKEIEAHEYRDTLEKLLKKKEKDITEKNPYKLKYKLAQFAISKGYENELVWEVINELYLTT